MKLFNLVLIKKLIPFISLFFILEPVHSQSVDLGISFAFDGNASNTVLVGSYFSVTGNIYHDINSSDVSAGENIVATIELLDPSGIVIDTHTQTWNGFPTNGVSGALDNDNSVVDQVLFFMPWVEASKWAPGDKRWQLVARVTGAASESDLSDNIFRHTFELEIPNLQVTSVAPVGANFRPNSDLIVNATVANNSNVQTQNGVFFPLEARLLRGTFNSSAGPQAGDIVDTERLILPFTDGGITPTIRANNSLTTNLPPLRIPHDAEGNYTVQVIVDPTDLQPLGSVVYESNETDNHIFYNFTVSNGLPNLQINPDSFTGEVGTFRGLDPVRIAFVVRNESNFAIEPEDEFTIRVALSLNNTFDSEDYILREFDLSGDALGDSLLPNEIIKLDWVQQMPDNLEGDYYLLVNIQETGQTFFLQNTPSISLFSRHFADTRVVSYEEDNATAELYNRLDEIDEELQNLEDLAIEYFQTSIARLLDAETTNDGGIVGPITSQALALRDEKATIIVELAGALMQDPKERPSTSRDGNWVAYTQLDENRIKQVYLAKAGTRPREENEDILVSSSLYDRSMGGNSHSLAPKISADGTTLVFHSSASDLVPSDENGVEDIFVYSIISEKLTRFSNVQGKESNGASFYPNLNSDGSIVVFESFSDNLVSNFSPFSYRQVYLWDRISGVTYSITNGNGDSHTPSVSGDGNRVVFASDANNLLPTNADQNSLRDVFLFNRDSNQTSILSVTQMGLSTDGGPSAQPQISGNGDYVVFRSEATNILSQGGITKVLIERGGVGYFGNVKIEIRDTTGFGSGAVLEIKNDGVDLYGQIIEEGIEIIVAGENYESPEITIVPDPGFPAPSQTAIVKAFLVNPGGEIYRVETMNPAFSLQRLSSSPLGGGGNMPSREPSISEDGRTVVYSTKSSNLLDINVTREDKKVFYNRPSRQALAEALIVGGIGEIEVLNSGSGYQNGFFIIDDYSGLGSGATASYDVDAFGRISSINIINSGQNYNVQTTVIGVENPRGGSGFIPGEIRFIKENGTDQDRTGGGKIHQIQMLEHGAGYYIGQDNNLILDQIISLEGDGVDANQDGLPDARINPEKVHIDPQKGGIYLEQTFLVRLLTTESLIGATLSISDANKTLELSFTRNFDANIPDSIAVNTKNNISEIRDEILTRISSTWGSPKSIFQGPQIENNATGGDSFLLSALSGRVTISNPSSIEVITESNMLFSGDGFTRATPVITNPPVIYGYSEVHSIQETIDLENGRKGLIGLPDDDTDDIYLFTEDASSGVYKNERVSVSKFGQPVNYLPTTLSVIPSNRFPVLSGNGRHIYFTSDAGERAGLIFDASNQIPTDFNNGRDLFHFDRLNNKPPESSISVHLLFPTAKINHSFAGSSQIPVVVQVDYEGMDLGGVDFYVNSERAGSLIEFQPELATNRYTGTFITPVKGEITIQAIAVNRNGNQLGGSEKSFVLIKQSDGTQPPLIFTETSNFSSATNISRLPVSVFGFDGDGFISGVQYYIDGSRFGDEILNSGDDISALPNFSNILEFNKTGVNSVFAIGRDNSGNYVSSDIFNIPITQGSSAPSISLSGGIQSQDKLDVGIETLNGEIIDVTLPAGPVGSNFVTPPKIQIFGSGFGAKLIAVIDEDITSEYYGKVIKIDIDPLYRGTGYDENTKIRLVPVVRAIGFGTPAEVRLTFADDGNGTSIPSRIIIRRNADQSAITGSGYVNSPRLVVPPRGAISNFERVPLVQTIGGSYGVDPSTFPIFLNTREPTDAYLEGGFTQSALNFEYTVSDPDKVQSVILMVDGREEGRREEPPFAFQWIPDVAKEYQVYAVAQDFYGNVIMTELNYISVDQFLGGGVEASFNMAQNITLPTNASVFLNGSASSEHGISEVEFYMEGQSLGKVLAEDGQNKFFKEVNLSGFSQGTFEISMVARDRAGNEASSFSPFTTSIPSRQNLRLTVVASSQDSSSNSLQLLYPNLSHSVKFSTQSSIPVIVDFNESSLLGGVNFAVVLLDGNPVQGVMSQHEVVDSSSPQLNDYITNRFTYSIDPSFTSVGKHILQAVLYSSDTGMPIAQTDFVEIEISDYAQLSPLASLQAIPEDFRHITDTSSVVFSVNAEDLDGSIEFVQFYVNGQAHGDPISRVSLVSESKSKYLLYFQPVSKGSQSIHAVATDTSGNNVATLVESILVTDGTNPSSVAFDENFINHEIPFSELDIQFDENYGITAIKGLSLNHKYTAEPEVRVRGIGSGAVVRSSLDSNGIIKELLVDPTAPGRGYNIENSSLIFIPSRRVVREGTPAEIITTWMDYSPGGPPSEVTENIASMVIRQQELQLQNNNDRLMNDANTTNFGFFGFFGGLPSSYFITEDWETTYSLKRSFDDSIASGEGYVVSPRFDPPIVIDDGNGRKLINRLTLTEPVNGTSSVNDFTFVKPGAFAKANLSGGFTRAPLYIQALPVDSYDNIESVSLMVNGIIDEEDRLTKKPYNFIWVPGDPEDYILSFVVKDYDGNIYTTAPQTLSVKDYYGSGIGSRFHGSIESEIQIGSEAIYSVQASSEFGVSEVEFYLDGESVGIGKPVGSGVYNLVLSFENLTQGAHFLSYVARDFKGNESGTFDAATTNLIEFKNKRVIVVSSSEQDPPTSYVYPKEASAGEISYRFWRGQQEVIIMIEAASDPDGYVEEIFLYSDGEMLQTSDGNFSISPNFNSVNLSQNLYAFKFFPDKLGIFELKAMVKDNFGTQKFSENTILIEVLSSSAQSPVINLISPVTDSVITTSSTIRFEANASDPDGTMESVQFYVNGLKHGDEIAFDRSYNESIFPYGINWSAPASGAYTIHAVAKDNDGNEVLSDYVVVNVANGDDLIPVIDFEDLSEQYLPNQTIFLSAQVTDASLGSNQNKGIVEEVVFYANGYVVDRITQQPFFARWMPMDNGLYEVYATAKDNEGNLAISNIQNVRIINETEVKETPALGSLNPSVSGSVIEIITETFRRNSQTNTNRSVITGLSTKFLNQLGTGQKIRFSNGKNQSINTYEIFSIEGDDKLILQKELEPEDKSLISTWSSLQIVPIYRAGSWISLNLSEDVQDSNFQYVDFYVDGTLMSRDNEWPFSGLFIPAKEGNYTLATISVSANGAQNLYTERIEVLPKVGLLPDGSTGIHPMLTRSGSTTIGSELIVTANYDDLDDGMNRVEFYLNGVLAYVDREKPFFFKFKPQTDGSILATDRAWEVTAVGIDNAGNRISLIQTGNVQSSVILPLAEVKSPSENEEFDDGQAIKIRVDVKGSNMESLLGINSMVTPNPNISLTPRRMNILANGVLIGLAVESSWGSGIFMADWICDLDFTGPSGEVELSGTIVMTDEVVAGLPFTPTVISNAIKITLKEPGGDIKSGVIQIYKDIVGESPSEQEVNLVLSEEITQSDEYLFDNDDFLRWSAHLTEREIFQNMVDSIAGYKIMVGNFPDYLKISDIMDTYSATPNYGQDGSLDGDGDGFSLRQENLFQTSDLDAADFPSSAFSMGSFVDDILSSSEYTSIHGKVPALTPPSGGADRFTNYEKNRRDFVRIIYTNKYGTSPTIQQETQGSYRISVFDPESKEAQQANQLMMMQQLAMYSNFGVGGVGGQGGGGGNVNPFASLLGNTNTQNPQQTAPAFRNGEPAVLFVVNMIAEESINNMDMIWGASSKRDYYKTAALISSIWQDNMGILSDKLIAEFHGKSTEQIISELMKDSRYYNRFGGFSISRHAQEVEGVPGWKWLHWFGHFNDSKFPWIYHSGLGWIYVHGPTDEQTWFYLPNSGWLGTSKDIWENMDYSSQYLWLYEQNNSRWVAYYLQQPGGKTFWDPQIQNYFTY